MRYSFLVFLLLCTSAIGQYNPTKTINYKKADSIALAHSGQSLRNLPLLTHELTVNLKTDIEKFRAIYTWVCTNIENDYHSYLKTRKKRRKMEKDREAFLAWNSSFTPKVFERLVEEKKTACTGYAYLINEMANLAGFKSKIINGYGRTPTLLLDAENPPNHSWNAIQLEGKWYLCDATWSAGRIMLDDGGPRFEQHYDDVYFLADPSLFIKNHFPLEKEFSLLKETPTLEEFIEGPVVYKEAFSNGIIPRLPTNMHVEVAKNEIITFDLIVPENFDTKSLHIDLNNGGRDIMVEPSIKFLQGNIVRLEYKFERTGLYDTHIKIGEDLVATYVVRVHRK